MQDLPDKSALLQAVAGFLQEELRPAIDDPALSFRVLIAAHLVATVAREEQTEDDHDAAQLARLAALLPEAEAPDTSSRDARHAAMREMNRRLAAQLRDGALDGDALRAARAHVDATLREKLAVINPRFDTSAEVE